MSNLFVDQVFIGQMAIDDIVRYNSKEMIPNNIGGSAIYATGGASMWGDKSGMVGRVGFDYDYDALKKIVKDGNVNVNGIIKMKGHGRRVWVLFDENEDHYFVPHYQSASAYDVSPETTDIPIEYIESASIFHISPFPVEKQSEIVDFLREKKKIITLDPQFESCSEKYLSYWKNILKKVDVFLPSEIEFKRFLGNNTKSLKIEEYESALIEFANKFHTNDIVLKIGEHGTIIYDSKTKKTTHFEAMKSNVLDCTGAGDSFAGGFCYSYKKNKDLYRSVISGMASASVTIEGFGAEHAFKNLNGEVQKRTLEYIKNLATPYKDDQIR